MRLGEFCVRHDLLICSDEIHCDLILDSLPHVPTALLGDEIARRTITFMAPSKTYNVPGLGTSIAIIPDAKLRTQFVRTAAGVMAEVTALGFAACEGRPTATASRGARDCSPTCAAIATSSSISWPANCRA